MNPGIFKYISSKAILLYIAALSVVSVIYMQYSLKWYWIVIGLISVVGFFKYGSTLYVKWGKYSPKLFEKKLFRTALIIRVIYVIFSYFFYLGMTGEPFEFGAADAMFYDYLGQSGARQISQGIFNIYDALGGFGGLGVSDSGYATYLSFVYSLTSNSIFIVRILKAILSAWTCLLIYRLAVRNFGDSVGRMAAIFCMLMPNLIYYCGLHLKETEMVFLTVLFIERADFLLRLKKIDIKVLFTVLLVGTSLFTFRTVLGAVAFLALFSALVLSSKRIISAGKKVILGFFVVILLGISLGDRISQEVEQVWSSRADNQSKSMAWRAERKGGNSYAKYASAVVFAPMIFTIPFPTIIETEGQENQRMINGGNFVKNITSFFTILALFTLLFSGEWRKNVLPIAFMCGYLLVIAMSAFAQSERFHLPTVPFALMFAAYGISKLEKKHQRWFYIWLMLVFIAIFAWSWFKLSGRGMA